MHREPTYPLISTVRLRMEVDGDGVTTLVAGAGCPLACKYCINKTVLQKTPENVTPQELFDRVKIDDLYFQATNGGLTFGGGEALLHTDFYRTFRPFCGAKWKLNAETSLAVPRENVTAAAEVLDDFIVDVKDTDPETYHAYTGGDGSLALENLRLLLSRVGAERIHVRVPLIPGYNDEAAQHRSETILREMGITDIELFSYIIRD